MNRPARVRRTIPQVLFAGMLSVAAVVAGAIALGPLAGTVFAVGYVGGFVLWLVRPGRVTFARIRMPYWLTLAAFVLLHKVEENRSGFFQVLAELSDRPVPEVTSPAVMTMLATGFAPWLLVPALMKRGNLLGSYLAWTFFASMGLSELAHVVLFPFLIEGPYRYFPGMWSILILAPLAWIGLWRLGTADSGKA